MWWQELEAAGHTALSGSREICFTQCRALAHAVGPPAVKVDLPTVIARSFLTDRSKVLSPLVEYSLSTVVVACLCHW